MRRRAPARSGNQPVSRQQQQLTSDRQTGARSFRSANVAPWRRDLREQLPILPAFAALGVMILWSAHDGGFDEDTWYWGALVMLSLLAVSVYTRGIKWVQLSQTRQLALIAFALYVVWSYASITWAASPGDALTGSNRALLYLTVFTLFTTAPWTAARARGVLLTYALGIGAIGAVLVLTMASGHQSASLFFHGRLLSPTGYVNSNAALFTSAALVSIALAARTEFRAALRGVLLALACLDIQLALLTGSRGWLFTLPFVLGAAIAVVPVRLRTAAIALLPSAGALIALPSILKVYESILGTNPPADAVVKAAQHAARTGLLGCAGILVASTLVARWDTGGRPGITSPERRRLIGVLAATLAIAASVTAALVATHGQPLSYVKRQLNGTTQTPTTKITHFAVGGTERYDIWRVSIDALLAHPIGGLGQDNFIEYYYRHRHTADEPRWTHSFELRLLAHTGLIGFALIGMFLAAGLKAAIRNRRERNSLNAAAAGIALLPLIVWLIHGSVDWFWEMPALAGPALGFLGMAAALGAGEDRRGPSRRRTDRIPRAVPIAAGALTFLLAVLVLAFPYLSVREVSVASDIQRQNPGAALQHLAVASDLNPLSANPGRLAGSIALETGRFSAAESSFHEATSRDPGGWFAWLGAGLAASQLGDAATARRDLAIAVSINPRQPAATQALHRLDTRTPLSPAQAFALLLAIQ